MKLDEITSNNVMICIHCGEPITLNNYSGWEAFADGGRVTQPICKFCNMVLDAGPGEKAEREGEPPEYRGSGIDVKLAG